MLDIIVIAVVASMAIWGFKSGFIRSVFHLGYYVISAIVATVFYPILTKFLMATKFAAFIRDEVIMKRIATDKPAVNAQSMPKFMQDLIEKPINDGVSTVTNAMATALTEIVINIICIILIFVIVRFGLKIIVEILSGIAKLPLLSTFNKFGGLVIGAANGIIIIYLVLAISTLFISNDFYKIIQSSSLTSEMYNNNLLMKIIFR